VLGTPVSLTATNPTLPRQDLGRDVVLGGVAGRNKVERYLALVLFFVKHRGTWPLQTI
jgi:hypothetical protein